MKIEILARRGEHYYLVKVNDEKFYLVNIESQKLIEGESPDMFYGHGYFEDPEVTEDLITQIKAILIYNQIIDTTKEGIKMRLSLIAD